MPLMHKKSEKAFEHNVKAEMDAHPGKEHRAQNLAIAYAIKRRAKKAHGGECMAEGGEARYKQDEGMSKQGRYVRQANFAKDNDYNEDSEGQPYMERAKDEAHKSMMKESMRPKKFPKHFAEGGEPELSLIDLAKSISRKGADNEPKGVHSVTTEKGVSRAREYEKYKPLGFSPKREHEKVLGEMQSMKGRYPKHMAHGGMMQNDASPGDGTEMAECPTCGGPHMSEASGFVDHPGNDVKANSRAMHEDHMDFNQHGDMDEGAGDMDHVSPIVRKIMMGRKVGFSEGGKVANSDLPMADKEENEFDDLHLRDDLEQHDTGANSGDELGDEQEDHDRKDIVSKIMASRKKKDRNPVPA